MLEPAVDRQGGSWTPTGAIDQLQLQAVEEISRHLPAGDRWVAVDYPMHWNVGDAAITLGQACVATKNGVTTSRVLDRTSYNPQLLDGTALPVIAGGGNWGGLYPTHHRLRLRVLEDARGREVLQMPQSIHYASEDHRDALRRAVARHGKVTLLVRDQRSHDIALRDYDCAVHLVPDLVFTLGKLHAPRPVLDVVMQARTDKEAPVDTPGSSAHFDWLAPPLTSLSWAVLRAAKLSNRFQRRLPTAGVPVNRVATSTLARVNLTRGLKLLARGRYVVTDRLHGHVLAHLIERPHVVVDDRFGKIRALHETWLADDPRSVLVPSWRQVPEALALLRERFPDG